jgi:hypothetical protein
MMIKSDLLDGNAILLDVFVAGLPDERDVAGVCCLKTPRQEGGDCISSHYAPVSTGRHCETKAQASNAVKGWRIL